MSDYIDRIRAFRAMYEQNGGHASPEAQDAMALLGDYEHLRAELKLAVDERTAALEDVAWLVDELAELRKYVRHDPMCNQHPDEQQHFSAYEWKKIMAGPCDCGLSELLAKYKEQP